VVKLVRRVGIAFGSFVIAWLAISLVARWLFGSGNVLVWVFAAIVGAGVYLDILRRDRRVGQRRPDTVEET
jgi:NhaP-type Na+/H+ or K+/H+ antiporter